MFPYLNLFGMKIPMYGLMMALAFIAAILVAYYRTRRAGLNTDKLLNIAIISILSGIVGAYVLYIIVTPEFRRELIDGIAHGQLSVFRDGGFVFYGGLIGGAAAALIYCKAAKLSVSDYIAVNVPVVPLAHGIGRIGCFCAGCCYGMPIDCALSVVYTHPIGGAPIGVPLFPIQLLESILNLLLFGILLLYARKHFKSLTVFFLYFIMYAAERFSLEFLRYDEIRGIFLGLSTSQWISIVLFIVGIAGFIVFTLKDKKKALAGAEECPEPSPEISENGKQADSDASAGDEASDGEASDGGSADEHDKSETEKPSGEGSDEQAADTESAADTDGISLNLFD